MIQLLLSEAASDLNAAMPEKDTAFKGCGIDTRDLSEGALYAALRGERFDGHDFISQAEEKGAAALLVEHPVASSLPVLQVADTRKALGCLAGLWRSRFKLPVTAITGSNGKTTVKEMLSSIFAQQGAVLATPGNKNNEIGVPLTLFGLDDAHQHAVVEMGANHPGEIKELAQITRPDVALITQCAPAHLAGFKNVDGVARAKGEIFSELHKDGVAVINDDDAYANLWRSLANGHKIIGFGLNKVAEVTARSIQVNALHAEFVLQTPGGEIPVSLNLAGRHNVMNALAAAACAIADGCELHTIKAGLEKMPEISGRLQQRTGPHGVTILDDTYNANPASLKAALAVLNTCPQPHWLVLGDMLELGGQSEDFHRQAGRWARDAGVERLFAVGPLSRFSVAAFGRGGAHFEDLQSLNSVLRDELPSGASLLVKGSRGSHMEKVLEALAN
ncbi:MAG: UDP-N-acetylmuramoyl-tripeptide--D-alanyl-D-alanine ligase [Gammaproteobacteria bacterium]|nr:UDP-N-acetylmuramoyl-tripeptide--D-alanyl-D-alanine ligase [Gammaproteobacteria bacterium]